MRTEAGRRRATTGAGGVSCLNVLPNVLPKCSADRCADGATTEGTVLAAAPKASIPRRSLPPFPRFPGFPGGCWEGQPGKRGKMELLRGPGWSPKTGPRTGLEKSLNTLEIVESVTGKMELLVTENKLEERGRQTPTWKGWKGWGFGVQKFRFSTLSTISRVFKIDLGTRFLGPVFGVQELHFSTLSTLSMLFGVHF